MGEMELLRQAADVGYPFALLAAITWAGKRIWADLWPWWRDVYWPAREARWKALHEEQAGRDKRYQELIARYENGHRTQSREEHQAIIRELREMGNAFADLFQGVMTEVKGWHKDTVHLIALSEQRADALENLLQKEAMSRED
jgi:hypothetical protein